MVSKYFKIYELVSPAVYIVHGEDAWKFIDPRLIKTLDFVRELFDVPITINDWWWKGEMTQRGLRENISDIVVTKSSQNILYLSGHVLGMAADFNVKGYTAEEVRKMLVTVQDDLPYPIRLEDDVLWVHIDMMNIGEEKVYIF